MSLIDWSDPDEMLGLLVEYVADEAITATDDAERARFLRGLRRELEHLADEESAPGDRIAQALSEIRDAQSGDFLSDPVLRHLDECIEELQRIGR